MMRRFTSRRSVAVATVVACLNCAGLLSLTELPAAAAPPAGSSQTCAGDSDATTLPELLELAEENNVPQANAQATFGRVNKNQDSWICVTHLPSQTGFNFTDNQAVGLSR